MQLNTKTEYAIRGLIGLATRGGENPVAIRQLCDTENLPVKYMERIFGKLKDAGLIKSLKGAYGGYVLNSDPATISLKDIMQALDDQPVKLNCDGKHGLREFCGGTPCTFLTVWEEIENEFENHLSEIRLSRFLGQNRRHYGKNLSQ